MQNLIVLPIHRSDQDTLQWLFSLIVNDIYSRLSDGLQLGEMWVSLFNEEKTNRKEEGIVKGNLLSEELMAELTIRMKK